MENRSEKNFLKNLDDFRNILSNYHVSEESKRILAETDLALLVGPTSAGRDTIIAELLKTGTYYQLVSDTTRKMRYKDRRPIEQNGRDYWFRSEEEVLEDLRQGKFIEAAIIHLQQVSGIHSREITKAHASGRTAITDFEPVGAETIYRLKPESKIIFVVPPSFEIWMERLKRRGHMHEDELHRRLQTAVQEFETALSKTYYHIVINDVLEDTVKRVDGLVKSGQHDAKLQEEGRRMVKMLMNKARAALE